MGKAPRKLSHGQPIPRPGGTRGELQISEEPAFQDRTWTVQRIGWACFVLLMVAAILGAFGAGPLSHRTAGTTGDGLRVEYEALTRLTASSELVVIVDRGRIAGERLDLLLGGDYVQAAEVESLLPRPSGGGLHPDGAVLSFDAHGGGGELRIVLQVKFHQIGMTRGEIRVLGGPAVRLSHWVYP